MKGRMQAERFMAAAWFLLCGLLEGCSFLSDALNKPVLEYFEYNTETAAITRYEILNGSWRRDSDGFINVGSEEELRVAFYLRNPQQFAFACGADGGDGNLFLEFPAAPEAAPKSEALIAQDESAAAVITLVCPASFLRAAECGGDISPEVRLLHPVSRADFGTYAGARLFCNSPPPLVRGATVCKDAEKGVYVLCFNMPAAALLADGTGIHRDICRLAVNGRQFGVLASGGRLVFSDGAFSVPAGGAVPPAVQKVAENSAEFVPESGRAVYFTTGDAVAVEDKVYEISYVDGRGLSEPSVISAQSQRLGDVRLFDSAGSQIEDGASIFQDEGRSSATVVMAAPERSADGAGAVAGASVIYEIYQGADASGTLLASGQADGTISIRIPAGQAFIRAVAHKNLYADSLPLERRIVVRMTRACVSASGDDGGNGSEDAPFKTVARAAAAMTDPDDARNTVVFLSDISEPLPVAIGGAGAASIVLDGGGHRWLWDSAVPGPHITVGAGSSLSVIGCRVSGGSISSSGTLVLTDAVLSGGAGLSMQGEGAALVVSGGTAVDGAIDFSAYTDRPSAAVEVAGALSERLVAAIRLGSAYKMGAAVLSGTDGWRLSAGDCARFEIDGGSYTIRLDEAGNRGILVRDGGMIDVPGIGSVVFRMTPPAGILYKSAIAEDSAAGTVSFTAVLDGVPIEPDSWRISADYGMNGSAHAVPEIITADAGRIAFTPILPVGTYYVLVSAVYKGVGYSASFTIQLEEAGHE